MTKSFGEFTGFSYTPSNLMKLSLLWAYGGKQVDGSKMTGQYTEKETVSRRWNGTIIGLLPEWWNCIAGVSVANLMADSQSEIPISFLRAKIITSSRLA